MSLHIKHNANSKMNHIKKDVKAFFAFSYSQFKSVKIAQKLCLNKLTY